jgi:hypothetical protein
LSVIYTVTIYFFKIVYCQSVFYKSLFKIKKSHVKVNLWFIIFITVIYRKFIFELATVNVIFIILWYWFFFSVKQIFREGGRAIFVKVVFMVHNFHLSLRQLSGKIMKKKIIIWDNNVWHRTNLQGITKIIGVCPNYSYIWNQYVPIQLNFFGPLTN